MPVQSVKLCAVSPETPSTLSLYAAAWNASAQIAGDGSIRKRSMGIERTEYSHWLPANSVKACPDVVLGFARFTSESNRNTPRGAGLA
jgi:hypothetical protein